MTCPDPWRRVCAWIALACLVLLAACGGGGGDGGTAASSGSAGSNTGGTSSGGGGTTPTLTNFTAVTIDDGPAALRAGVNPYRQVNVPFVTITVCAPGTSTCQTIDHVEVDTGSVGLRLVAGALDAGLLAALPHQTLANGDEVGECYGYVDGYVFGSVRAADFKVGGETVAGMPIHIVENGGRYAATPSACSSGGGTRFTDVKGFGANGILGIGVAQTDCGQACTVAGGYTAAIYYDCGTDGCGTIVARASTTAAPFQQLPNPVATFAADNNGSILELPQPSAGGAATAGGTLTFGIGTQTNNGLGSATVLQTTTSTGNDGYGLLTATYGGRTLPNSFIDSGSNALLFSDSQITLCGGDNAGFYCPPAATALAATLRGSDGGSVGVTTTLVNGDTLLAQGGAALPGLGADPGRFDELSPYPDSFDFGLPFFYGRRVFTAIEGRSAGGRTGPFVAF